jgi:hypothetical protein
VCTHQAWQFLVQVREVGEATAEHDRLGIEQVDGVGEATREPTGMTAQGGAGRIVARGGEAGYLLRGQLRASPAFVIPLQAGAR